MNFCQGHHEAITEQNWLEFRPEYLDEEETKICQAIMRTTVEETHDAREEKVDQ